MTLNYPGSSEGDRESVKRALLMEEIMFNVLSIFNSIQILMIAVIFHYKKTIGWKD